MNSTCASGKARLPTRPCQKLALWDRKGNALFCFRASIKHAQTRWTYTWNQNKGTERGLKPVLVGLSFRSLSPILFFTFRCFSFLLFCFDILDLCHSRFFFEFLLLFLWFSLQFMFYLLFCFPVCTFLFFVSVIYFCTVSTLVSLLIFHVPFLVLFSFSSLPRDTGTDSISTGLTVLRLIHLLTCTVEPLLLQGHSQRNMGFTPPLMTASRICFFIDYGLQGLKRLKYDLFLVVFIWGKLPLIWDSGCMETYLITGMDRETLLGSSDLLYPKNHWKQCLVTCG